MNKNQIQQLTDITVGSFPLALAVALEGLLAGPVDTARKPDALGAVGGLPATVEP